MTRNPSKLYVVREPDGDHGGNEYADLYFGDQIIGGAFGSPEHLLIVTEAFNLYNQARVAPQEKES